ncbi:MAG TPA: metallophosphoesterase family protein [Gaiellales bacterium]|jgi:diadenosine tetraphosphatase ApaH/serine/threonine PP2A family protein phosphatase|nr:metallophosphoesterase family protein [Gaiellales bacterium]
MRVAVISDVHGNVQALEAVLAAIDELQVDEIWSLGDVVGYGADPVRCTEIVDERAAVSLGGNHDLVVAGTIDIDMFAHDARDAAEWSRTVLSAEQIDALGSRMPGGEREGVQMFHGSVRDPVWEYVVDQRTAALCLERQRRPLCLVGHSHVQLLWGYENGDLVGGSVAAGAQLAYGDGPFIVNPGSVGQPRDNDPRAGYLLLDTAESTVTWLRAEYDIRSAQAAIRDAGLPLRLAARLAEGR